MLPILETKYSNDFWFQQDNCPIHVSKLMKDFFNTSNLKVLPWPARSPDLNIMENIWKCLSDKIYNGPQCSNVAVLREKLSISVDNFNSIRKKDCINLYTTFYKRLFSVLKKMV